MAKVALITEEASPVVENLARALRDQKQEVVLVTSKSAAEHVPPELTVVAPFQRWSTFEALRALPSLLSQNFDVWHFVFPSPELRPRAAQWLLARFARSLPQKVVAGSFSNPRNFRGWSGAFVSLMDLALFANRAHLLQAKREHQLSDHTLADVLPPLEAIPHETAAPLRDDLVRLTERLSSPVILPDLQNGPDWLEHSPIDWVVLKSPPARGPRNPHVFYAGEVTAPERDHLLARARALCLLFGDYSGLELQRFHQWSEKHQLPLLVREDQTETWPGLCWHLKSGWVLPAQGHSLRQLLIENPQLKLPGAFENYSRRELVDSTLNQLLRLYQKSFALRWT